MEVENGVWFPGQTESAVQETPTFTTERDLGRTKILLLFSEISGHANLLVLLFPV